MHLAVQNDRQDIVKILLAAKASIDATNKVRIGVGWRGMDRKGSKAARTSSCYLYLLSRLKVRLTSLFFLE